MSFIVLLIVVFWSTVVVGSVVTAGMLPVLRATGMYKKADRKKTLYGTEATEFRKIKEREEEGIKKDPVPRVGGLLLIPTILLIGIPLGLFLSSPTFLGSPVFSGSHAFILSILAVTAVFLVALYDDLTDIGILKCRHLRVRERLLLMGAVAFVFGYGFAVHVIDTVTLLPFSPFEFMQLSPVVVGILFAVWCVFWQVSSIIDGIDGLSGSIFLALFFGTLILSVLHNNPETAVLSVLGLGVLVPWLAVNYAPAKVYMTETGITICIMLFAVITFLLSADSAGGDGLWSACIFGIVLIATWVSNILQLLYRKKTGKKLFRIAPLHHHFEAIGIPAGSVVLRYTLATFLCVALGLSLILIV